MQPPIKVRLQREADRSRLAKDILKQLGKPSGSVPTVPTKREYEVQKKAEAEMEATSTQSPAVPVTEPPLVLNHDDPPLTSEVVPVPDQVVPSGFSADLPPVTPAGEPPSLEYPDPDPHSTPQDADTAERDVNMDIQPPDDPLVPQRLASPKSNLPQGSVPSPVVPEPALDREERSAVNHPLPLGAPSSKRSGPPPDAEIIEISDDEEQSTVDPVTTTIEPMEVDEEVGTGGPISQSLFELSLDGDHTPVAVETEKERTKKPPGRRPSQDLIGSEDVQLVEKKLQRNRPSVELPPLPEYARQIKGKERAPVQEEDEEGLYEVSILWVWFLTYGSFPRPGTSSCRRLGIL